MSELAFDKEGNPFRFSRRTKKLRPRRWKNAGQRGTCAAVLNADGEQLLIDADAEYVEFRSAVGNVPGYYRLDQCDEDGTSIEDAPPAYVSIESTRNAAPVGDADPRDAIIRDLAQINAEVTRTIAERFGNVMQAAADILRAADSAGLSRREPPPPPPPPPPAPNRDDEDDDQEDEDEDDHEPTASEKLWAFVEPMLPAIQMWIAAMVAKRSSSTPPGATPPAAPAPAPEPAPAAAPSAATGPGDVAPGPSEPAPAAAPAPAASSTTAAQVATPATAAASSPTAPEATASENPPPGSAAPSSSALTPATPAGLGPTDGTRNAPPAVMPTPEQWAHLFAIQAQLSPREAAIAKSVVTRMTPEMRAQWLAELSVLSVDQAADVVRALIAKALPKNS
jgi:hypothetical protein